MPHCSQGRTIFFLQDVLSPALIRETYAASMVVRVLAGSMRGLGRAGRGTFWDAAGSIILASFKADQISSLRHLFRSARQSTHRVRPTICDGGGVEPREFNHLPALSTLVSNRPIGR